ncbi:MULTISPECIES: hypothetical protein [unclassified Microbacterium]|uniref:hypothetical protein n=1 Tax=unclassified Microbacterium TaxID=2609290 RepID=UPI0016051656|nr:MULTISPECIES: hypothetical protein [unclassified Microbacterium]QNA93262.1 hypothetical protein G4G29_14755 [Microbacterium sp. Se63.02b]QYM63471.1 hypothetical protein K1X59_14805 [Microbacterium sp. Se5.02b]
MADAPEIILNRALAQLLNDRGLAVYATTGVIPPRGIRLDGVMPLIDEFTLLTPLRPIPDGRADMTYRTQIYTRRKGSVLVARNWAADLRAVLDQKEYTPAVLGISWAWEFSGDDHEPDSQGRSAAVSTYYFRGRRP